MEHKIPPKLGGFPVNVEAVGIADDGTEQNSKLAVNQLARPWKAGLVLNGRSVKPPAWHAKPPIDIGPNLSVTVGPFNPEGEVLIPLRTHGKPMRAYVLKHYGGPEGSRLMDIPAPSPRPREILVEVRAAGLNPVDFKFRQGKLRAILRPKLPFVLGNDVAGEAVAVGSEVKRFRAGDHVFARVAKNSGGAFAEQVSVDEDHVAPMPRNLDFTAAAAVPLTGLTALQALRDELGVKPGQKVFISGGAGGVGTFAIQIAKWLGAHVTTTASKRGEALVRSLGCDEVIDYTAQDISKAGGRFDAGFDLIGGKTLEQMFEVMKPGAKIVSIAALPEPQTAIKDLGDRRALSALFWIISYGIRSRARRAGIGYRYLFMHPSGSDLAQLAELIEQGTLKVVVDKTYPFAEISEALAYVERGRAKGKVVVTMS